MFTIVWIFFLIIIGTARFSVFFFYFVLIESRSELVFMFHFINDFHTTKKKLYPVVDAYLFYKQNLEFLIIISTT